MAVAKRVSREIKDPKDIEYLVKLTEDDITTSLIMELFGDLVTISGLILTIS